MFCLEDNMVFTTDFADALGQWIADILPFQNADAHTRFVMVLPFQTLLKSAA